VYTGGLTPRRSRLSTPRPGAAHRKVAGAHRRANAAPLSSLNTAPRSGAPCPGAAHRKVAGAHRRANAAPLSSLNTALKSGAP